MLLAQCTEHHIVPHVLPFIKENIKNPDWRRRDAAVMTLGEFMLWINLGLWETAHLPLP